jgi:MFS family permease
MTTIRANLRALPAAAWILFLGTFVNRFGAFVMPFLVLYLTRLGYSPARAGLALAAYGRGLVVASLVGGHLADRVGRRHTIAISMFSSAAAMMVLSQARSYGAIVILAAVAGFASELYRPAASALIGDLVTPEQRITAFAMYRFAINLGWAAGPATAGFLADRSFFFLFLGDAATSLGYGIIALAFLPHGLRSSGIGERIGDAFRITIRDRRFMLFLAATTLVTMVDFQTGSTFPLWVERNGHSGSTYGLLLSINGVLIIVFELMITSWTQRYPAQRMIALGYFFSGIGVAMTGLAHGIPALAATVCVWTLGEMIASPVTGAYVTDLAPEQYRGRYNGLWVFAWSIALVIGPSIGTLVFQYSTTALWIGCAAITCVATVLAWWQPKERTTGAPPSGGPGPLRFSA